MNYPLVGNIIEEKGRNNNKRQSSPKQNYNNFIQGPEITIYFKLISENPLISNSNSKLILIVQSCACDNLWFT